MLNHTCLIEMAHSSKRGSSASSSSTRPVAAGVSLQPAGGRAGRIGTSAQSFLSPQHPQNLCHMPDVSPQVTHHAAATRSPSLGGQYMEITLADGGTQESGLPRCLHSQSAAGPSLWPRSHKFMKGRGSKVSEMLSFSTFGCLFHRTGRTASNTASRGKGRL